MCLPTSSATNAAALGREAVVVAHNELRFDLLYRVHSYAHDDQKRCASEVEVDAEAMGHPCGKSVKDSPDQPQMVEVDTADEDGRNELNNDQVKGSYKGDPSEDVVDEVGGAAARTDAAPPTSSTTSSLGS